MSSTAGATLTFTAATRLLVVAPHPDDESIAAGLLIQQVRAAGGQVQILLLTAGDNNPWPQRWLERRLRIGVADRQRWGRRRHAEMRQAMGILDVPEQALRSMDWPDMGITDSLIRHGSRIVAGMAEAIDAFHPDLVAMPSINDRHPDHGAAHVLVRLALTGRPDPPRQLAYLIHGNREAAGELEIRGTPAQQIRKNEALGAHRTQMALSGRRMRRLGAMPERYQLVPTAADDLVTALPWQPAAWLRPWLRVSLADQQGARSWRWRDAPLRRDEHGRYHLIPGDRTPSGLRFVRLAWGLRTFWIFDYWGWQKT
jgi:LmbE family N-acetylglucosaminyl deacetylase